MQSQPLTSLVNHPKLSIPVEFESYIKDKSSLLLTLMLTSGSSVSALWLHHQPDWSSVIALVPTSSVNTQTLNTAYFKRSDQINLATLSTPSNLPPENRRSIGISQAFTPFSPSTVDADQSVSDTEILKQAHIIANRVEAFAKTVQSTDDWGLVTSQWRKAIALLASIPADSPHYRNAQEQIKTYQNRLQVAQQKANQPIIEAPMPTTRIHIMNGVVCQPKPFALDAPAVEISDVKVKNGSIVGCVTNHTNKTIHDLTFNYDVTLTNHADLEQTSSTTVELPIVAPNQTQAFQTRVTPRPSH